jgi:hypothetical protein
MRECLHTAPQRLKRIYSLARRPCLLMAAGAAARDRISSMPVDELRIAAQAMDLALRRERARSAMRHWSYDINRHIAMKAARDRITDEIGRRKARRQKKKAAD